MNRNIIALTVFLFTVAPVLAQQGRLQLPMDYVQNSITGKNNVPTNVLGSPYLDEEFLPGTVSIKETDSYQAYMRYNAFHDEIEMQENNQAVALMKRDYVTAKIGSDLYKIVKYKEGNTPKQGYVVVKKEGPTSFYLKNKMTLKEGKEATSSYSKDQPPKFELEQTYFLAFGEEIATDVKLNKKSILGVFKDNQKALEHYVKEKKLKLKSESEVLALLNYYDSL